MPVVRVPAGGRADGGRAGRRVLYIYLCHWQIYPAYEFSLPWLATGLSLAAGIAFWRLSVGSRVEGRLAGGLPAERRGCMSGGK